MTDIASILVMGPAGCGKTTVGSALADALGSVFLDADDYHPPINRARMARGEPLTDADRSPWLARVASVVAEREHRGDGVILACSALKRRYRSALGFPAENRAVVALRLSRAALMSRLAHRRGHFFPAPLLDDQLATLEPPDDAVAIDGEAPVAAVVGCIQQCLGLGSGGRA